jgi:OmpA-OmpF porin, OOP family
MNKKMRTSKQAFFTLVFGLAFSLLLGCASTPEQRRITDGVIRSDQRSIANLQTRMSVINAQGVKADDYFLSKATAWLDFATEEYTDNDRSGIFERLMNEARLLIEQLEAKRTDISRKTTIVEGSQLIRPDLWAKLQGFGQHKEFECVAGKVGRAEVQLVWAGHEELEGGWRHAKPYIEIAEDMVKSIDKAMAICAAPLVVAKPTEPVPVAQALPSVQTVEAMQSISIATDTLFKFDKAAIEDLLPEGRRLLDDLVKRLVKFKSIERILITGHTDRLGSASYNLKLSEQRAAAVKQFLIQAGLAASTIQQAGAGESDPLVTCSGDKPSAELQVCLQPNRRVDLRIKATP